MNDKVLVKEAMKSNPVLVFPQTTVFEAAELMKKHKNDTILVVDGKHPVGIVTERDIVKKVVAENKNPGKTLIKEVMTTPVMIIDPYVTIDDAMKLMGKCNIRRLPVVENNTLIGLITQNDISRISPTLHEISREWSDIADRNEATGKNLVFSGKCEDCGMLSSNLKNYDGQLLCEDCKDAFKYDEEVIGEEAKGGEE